MTRRSMFTVRPQQGGQARPACPQQPERASDLAHGAAHVVPVQRVGVRRRGRPSARLVVQLGFDRALVAREAC